MLGRLRMDIDTCITTYGRLGSVVFQPKRAKQNFLMRVIDFFRVTGTFSSKSLEREIRSIIEDVERDAEAKLISPEPSCRV
jgi:hypothetical protein